MALEFACVFIRTHVFVPLDICVYLYVCNAFLKVFLYVVGWIVLFSFFFFFETGISWG